jgi:hypothetical protein
MSKKMMRFKVVALFGMIAVVAIVYYWIYQLNSINIVTFNVLEKLALKNKVLERGWDTRFESSYIVDNSKPKDKIINTGFTRFITNKYLDENKNNTEWEQNERVIYPSSPDRVFLKVLLAVPRHYFLDMTEDQFLKISSTYKDAVLKEINFSPVTPAEKIEYYNREHLRQFPLEVSKHMVQTKSPIDFTISPGHINYHVNAVLIATVGNSNYNNKIRFSGEEEHIILDYGALDELLLFTIGRAVKSDTIAIVFELDTIYIDSLLSIQYKETAPAEFHSKSISK